MSAPAPDMTGWSIPGRIGDGVDVRVTADRRVMVTTSEGTGPLGEWTVLAALDADLPWFAKARRLERTLTLIPDADANELVQAIALGPSQRLDLVERAEDGDPALAVLAYDRKLEIANAALLRLRNHGWERDVLLDRAQDAHTDYTVADALMGNPHSPDEALVHMAAHPDEEVREQLAERDYLPVQAMFVLAMNPEGEAAQEVAERDDLPDTLAGYLATVRSTLVRGTIARRPTCPPGILANLVVDADPMTRVEALHTIKRYHAPKDGFDADTATKPQRPITGAEWADAVRGNRRTWDPWAR